MSSQTNNEVIAPQKNRTILQLPILGDLNDDNWLLVTSNNSTYRIEAGVFARLLGALALDKVDLGLDQVDNTSDMDKPISNATMGALEGKADISHTHEVSDIEGLKEFVDDILDSTLEIRSYVRSDVLELLLSAKADKAEILEYLDNKVDKTTLEILVTNEELEAALALKADKAFVETLAVQADVDEALALKADKTDIQALDFSKADKADVLNLATKDELTDRLVAKLDVSAAEGFITRLAMEEALEEKVGVDELAPYATKEEVGLDLSFKADKTALDALATKSELAEGLDGKIDKIVAGTYATKQELTSYHTKEEVDEALSLKLNISDFEDAVADIQAQKGDKGDPGEPGADGKDGVDGAPGADGKDGVDGKNAYEVALEDGFEGTLTEWLLSLKGEKGEKGDPGEGGSGTAGSSKGIFDYKNLLLDSSLYCTINEIPAFSWDIIKTEPDYLKDYGDASAAETNPAIAQQFKLENNLISSSFIFFYGTPSEFTDTTEVRRLVPKFIDSNSYYKLAKEDSSLSFSVAYSYNVGTTLNLKMSFFDITGAEISSVTSNMVDFFPITQEMLNDPSLLLGAIKKETTHISSIIPENAVYVKPEIIIYITPSQLELSKRCNMYISDFQLEANSESTEFENNELIESLQKLTNLSTIEKMVSYYDLDTDQDNNKVLDVKQHNKMILFESSGTETLYVPNGLPDGFRCDIYTRGKVNVIGPDIKWKDNTPRVITEFAPMSITKMGSYRGYFAFGGEIVI